MPTKAELRKHRCCFTGHRPEKLRAAEEKIKAALIREIKAAISNGYSVFISGMARGVDLWAAEAVLDLRARGEAVRLICAVPYLGFESQWEQGWRDIYQTVLGGADLTRFICPQYRPDCFQRRNQWMVDHSARVIAVYNGARGGTWNTLAYASAQGVPVVKISCGEGEAER